MNKNSMVRGYLAAGVIAGVTLLLAISIVLQEPEDTRISDAREVRGLVAEAVLPLVEAVEDQRSSAGLGVGYGSTSYGLDDPSGPSPEVAALARDSGRPVLDAADGGRIVVPSYSPPAPTTVSARREQIVGYTVFPLSLEPTLRTLAGDEGTLALVSPQGPVAASAGDTDSAPTETYSVPVDEVSPGWKLQGAVPRTGLTAGTLLSSVVIALLGLAIALFVVRRARLSVAAQSELLQALAAESTMAELSAVSRGSLDLAEVLPASAAVLESAFGLAGLALQSAAGRPTFSWGHAPDDDVDVVVSDTAHRGRVLPSARCAEFPLARGGRSLGSLRIRAGRELSGRDLNTLSQAAAILSSSVANAEAYQHQRELIGRMRRLDDLKTVFVATASHELRTPVAAITGFASMLNESWDDLDPDTARTYADRVDTNARRLGSLVEHLLDFSRLEQGGVYSGESIPIDLGEQVRSLTDGHTEMATDHQLSVRVEPGVVVLGSELAVERVLTNLVGNAAKYSPAGTTIWVRVERAEDRALLIVDDEGPGIPGSEREQIFSRFFRGTGDAVIRTRGAGLGLSIVTEFAGSMHGEVTVADAPTGGARFSVSYPLHNPADDGGTR